MKDLTKFQAGMERLFETDKQIRDALRKYDTLFGKPREIILNEAGYRQAHHKETVLHILKKLFDEYNNEIGAASHIMGDVVDRLDRALTLERKLRGAA